MEGSTLPTGSRASAISGGVEELYSTARMKRTLPPRVQLGPESRVHGRYERDTKKNRAKFGFSYKVEYANDSLFFALHFPYSYSYLQRYRARLCEHPNLGTCTTCK